MQAVLVTLASLSYVIHMTFGCCLIHEHFGSAGKCQSSIACHHAAHSSGSHHGHSHGDHSPSDEGKQTPEKCPHNHSHHDDGCVGMTTTSKAKLLDEGLVSHVAAEPAISLPVAIVEASWLLSSGPPIAVAPPVRAHLAKLVITI